MTPLERLQARPWALPLARTVFWLTLASVFIVAEIPERYHPPDLFGWDKANHFAAFYVLSVLAAAAYPLRSALSLGVGLSALGGLIELVQALPFIHRDADVIDWLADTIAIVAALGPLLLASWRRSFVRPPN